MRNLRWTALVVMGSAVAFSCLPLPAEEPSALSQAEMQRILQTISAPSPPGGVDYTALNRAAIDGLLRQNAGTMQLLTVPAAPAAGNPGILSAVLAPSGIAWVRPAAPGVSHEALKTAVTAFAAGEAPALILDLRAPVPDSDPAEAAAAASLFLPKDTPLFSFPAPVRTVTDPVWTRDLAVLTDAETSNAAETLAAVLKQQRRALVIGSPTRGRTAAVTELVLRESPDNRLVFRTTGARVTFSADDPFGKGITPDVAAALEPDAKQAAFKLQALGSVADTVFQPARPRNNEAALTSRINPELPERIARTAGRMPAPAPVDRPLQAAMDILTARRILPEAAQDR